jgi:hypothetical protein
MHHLIGTGKELPIAELPTGRDLLRYGLYLRECSATNARNYSGDQLVDEVTEGMLAIWERANAKFCEPVINTKRRIKTKVKALWEQATEIALGRGRLDEKHKFIEKLDRLVDILNCKCDIIYCAEFGCGDGCSSAVHINCTCIKEKKIPVLELAFVKAQRVKIGSKSSQQIGSIDIPESRRQIKQQQRQENHERAVEKRRNKADEAEEELRTRAQSFEKDLNDAELAEDSMQEVVHLEDVTEGGPSASQKRMKCNKIAVIKFKKEI